MDFGIVVRIAQQLRLHHCDSRKERNFTLDREELRYSMRRSTPKTSVYLVAYHSEHYDNGDDPSFFVERKGGRLTWGVCRQELRTSLKPGSIVTFFSFTTEPAGTILYRLSAVATVAERLDHSVPFSDARLKGWTYINTMIKPVQTGWEYDETDRPRSERHGDWFWRMADHRGVAKKEFGETIHREGKFSKQDVTDGKVQFANNYILFSDDPNETYVSPNPPPVARSSRSLHESHLGVR